MGEVRIERSPQGADSNEQLRISGSVTIAHAAQVKEALVAALEAADEVQVDLSELEEIDLTGLQLLCVAHQSALKRGKVLQVRDGGSEKYRLVVDNSGFHRHLGCSHDNSNSCIWFGGES